MHDVDENLHVDPPVHSPPMCTHTIHTPTSYIVPQCCAQIPTHTCTASTYTHLCSHTCIHLRTHATNTQDSPCIQSFLPTACIQHSNLSEKVVANQDCFLLHIQTSSYSTLDTRFHRSMEHQVWNTKHGTPSMELSRKNANNQSPNLHFLLLLGRGWLSLDRE